MPAGVSWPKYITFMATALASMFAGAQCVHVYYRPLEDLDRFIKEEMKNVK